jgi:hypothetical protein
MNKENDVTMAEVIGDTTTMPQIKVSITSKGLVEITQTCESCITDDDFGYSCQSIELHPDQVPIICQWITTAASSAGRSLR